MIEASYICAEVKEEAGGLWSAAFHTDAPYADAERSLDYFILVAPDAHRFIEGHTYLFSIRADHDSDVVITQS